MTAAVHTALRIPPDDLAEIDRRAQERGISRTALLINSALERLPHHTYSTDERVNELEQRIQRLEDAVYATSY